jgi:hypothetical protein
MTKEAYFVCNVFEDNRLFCNEFLVIGDDARQYSTLAYFQIVSATMCFLLKDIYSLTRHINSSNEGSNEGGSSIVGDGGVVELVVHGGAERAQGSIVGFAYAALSLRKLKIPRSHHAN